MKRKRFSEELIIGVLKEHEAGTTIVELSCPAAMALLNRRFTAGSRSTVAWRCLTRNAFGRWSRRTGS